MLILHIILFFLFFAIGIFGLIFKVDIGVLVGFLLIPWEVRMIQAISGKTNRKLTKLLVIICGAVGAGYFLIHQLWSRVLIIVLVQGYIFYVVNRSKTIHNENPNN